MASVKVNRSTHPASFKKSKSFGQLLALLEKEGEGKNQYITSLKMNGRKVDEEEEKLIESLSIDEIDELIIEFSSLSQIVGTSIRDMIAKIQDIQLRSIQFAKDFKNSEKLDDEKIKFILIECRSVIMGLEQVFQSHIKGQFLLKHSSLWTEAERVLTNILQCILQSRHISPVEFVADLLEYELVEALDQWEEVLEKELLENSQFVGIFSLIPTDPRSDNGVDV